MMRCDKQAISLTIFRVDLVGLGQKCDGEDGGERLWENALFEGKHVCFLLTHKCT